MLREEFRRRTGRSLPRWWQWRHGLSRRFARSTYELLDAKQLARIVSDKLRKFRERTRWRALDDTRSGWRDWPDDPAALEALGKNELVARATELFYNDPDFIWGGGGFFNMLLGRHIGGGRNTPLDVDLPPAFNMRPGDGPLIDYGPNPTGYDIWNLADQYLPPAKTIGGAVDVPPAPPKPPGPKTIGPADGAGASGNRVAGCLLYTSDAADDQ